MSYQPEIEMLKNKIIEQLNSLHLSEQQKNLIHQVIQESYDTGYEDGLSDGEEISDKPISG